MARAWASDAEAASVGTAAELAAAMAREVSHITVTHHLDLSSLAPVSVPVSEGSHGGNDALRDALDAVTGGSLGERSDAMQVLLGNVRTGTETIRGNCTEPPTDDLVAAALRGSPAPLLPLLPRQCLLLADTDVLSVPEDTNVWLDGLYLRFMRTPRSPPRPLLMSIGSAAIFNGTEKIAGTLFMSGVTFQGDRVYNGDAAVTGEGTGVTGISHVHAEEAGSAETCRILAQDCVFANLGGGVTTSVALVNVQASFLRCDFRGNVAEVPQATVLSAGGTAAVRLDQCRFDGNAGAGQLALDWTAKPPMSMSGYFSDEGVAGSLKVAPGGGGGGGGGGPVCHCRAGAEAAMTLAAAPTVFLTPSDNWLTGVQEDLGYINRTADGAGGSSGAPQPNTLGTCAALAPHQHCRSELTDVTAPRTSGGGGAAHTHAPAAAAAPVASPYNGLGARTVAVVVVACAVVIAAVALAAVCLVRSRRRATSGRKASNASHSDCTLARKIDRAHSSKTSRRGALSDSAQDSIADLSSCMRATCTAPYAIRSSRDGQPATPPPSSPTTCPSDHINMLSFPALGAAAVSGGTTTLPLLAGGSTTEGSTVGGETESYSRGTVWGAPDATSAALLMQSRSIESNLSQYARPTLGPSADIAATGYPRMLPDSAGGASAQSTLPPEAVEYHRQLFHPATQLGTLEQSNAFQTLARTVVGAPAQDPGECATSAQRLDFIAAQLDSLGRQALVLQKYELLGRDQRRRGGQAVVQFVRAPQTNVVYAMKLFMSRRVFHDEHRLYLNSGLASFMPTVAEFVDNADGEFVDANGTPMPPLLIMEKGETLTERIHRCKHNIFTTIQILGQVGQCLAELHSRGWVHRDLKPGNIMFLPRRGTWTLIDFGLVARAGDEASVGFTLLYAAPEVIAASAAQAPSITVDPAVDAWALGVMAFELLTGRPAFNMFFLGAEEVERQLRGEAELPWEGERLAPDLRRRLGTLRVPVLSMLHRDPTQRWTCEQFWRALHAVFSGQTTSDAAP